MPKFNDLTGMRFGRLTVIERVENRGNYAMWRCRCDCGGETITRTSSLKNGHTKSCGCRQKQIVSKLMTKHGMCKNRLYRIYQHMIRRCTAPNETGYENYGGRGIKVCNDWRNSFAVFADWAVKHGYDNMLTLDRIDVNGDYEPSNCRWATMVEQARNKRDNRILEFAGQSHTMKDWSEILNIPYGLINSRIFRGWSTERTLTTPRNEKYVH